MLTKQERAEMVERQEKYRAICLRDGIVPEGIFLDRERLLADLAELHALVESQDAAVQDGYAIEDKLSERLAAMDAVVEAAAPIRDLILSVENRAMASDGPVTPTFSEITRAELKTLERLLGQMIAALERTTP